MKEMILVFDELVVIAIAVLVIKLSLHPNSRYAIATLLSGLGNDGRRKMSFTLRVKRILSCPGRTGSLLWATKEAKLSARNFSVKVSG